VQEGVSCEEAQKAQRDEQDGRQNHGRAESFRRDWPRQPRLAETP
jgi:hypothetical protein